MDNKNFRLIVTDADTIATRTDPWDPGTEVSRSARDAATLVLEQADVLVRAQARLDELIGLEGPKEQIARGLQQRTVHCGGPKRSHRPILIAQLPEAPPPRQRDVGGG